jgi:hypothetical protein
MRDYDLAIDVPAAVSGGRSPYIEGCYRYRFTHCVVANVTTMVSDSIWKRSWDERFIDYSVWQAAGSPDGYVWGVCWAVAYPGLRYVETSLDAQEWTERLGRLMHEVVIETNTYELRLIFHDVDIQKEK